MFCLFSGKNRIWYAGASVSFESVRSVISYNNRLLKQMVPLSSFKSKTYTSSIKKMFHSQQGSSNNNCQYSCSSGGGCKVKENSHILQFFHFIFRFNTEATHWVPASPEEELVLAHQRIARTATKSSNVDKELN